MKTSTAISARQMDNAKQYADDGLAIESAK